MCEETLGTLCPPDKLTAGLLCDLSEVFEKHGLMLPRNEGKDGNIAMARITLLLREAIGLMLDAPGKSGEVEG